MKRKLLIAAGKIPYEKVKAVLSPYFELSHEVTLEAALAAARLEKPDAIVCTLLFDDSRAFDLLTAIKNDPELASIPLIACNASTLATAEVTAR